MDNLGSLCGSYCGEKVWGRKLSCAKRPRQGAIGLRLPARDPAVGSGGQPSAADRLLAHGSLPEPAGRPTPGTCPPPSARHTRLISALQEGWAVIRLAARSGQPLAIRRLTCLARGGVAHPRPLLKASLPAPGSGPAFSPAPWRSCMSLRVMETL